MSVNFGNTSLKLLKYERAKAKLNEFSVSDEERRANRVEQITSNELLYSTVRVLSQYTAQYLNGEVNAELYDDLTFVAHFYENYVQAEQVEGDYLFYLVGAIANVLSDNFGNAKSLIGRMENFEISNTWGYFVYKYIARGLGAKCREIEWGDERQRALFHELLYEIHSNVEVRGLQKLVGIANELLSGFDNEAAFLSFMLCAIHKKFVDNSAIRLIPAASNSNSKDWERYFERRNSISILWQAQKLMLEKDVLKGADATIQLPTGVGKTKSVELIISAAFLLRNVSLAIVVAPLRALCNEIEKDLRRSLRNIVKVTALSDVLEDEQLNYEQKQVVVLTPEKLSFLIKHNSDIIQKSGLIIFDEAHMFDDVTRGASYELLIVRIKELLPQDTQCVFISAIMPNVAELNEWLTDGGNIVSDSRIKRTEKSVAFYSRIANELFFYQQEDLIGCCEGTVYIPNACTREPLVQSVCKKGKNKGKVQDTFPDLSKGMDIAIYLACKLSNRENCSAIYVNQPKLIVSVSRRLAWIKQSSCNLLRNIVAESDTESNNKIVNLAKKHYGADNDYVKMMELGFFPHFGGLENGLRLSIEHAIRQHDVSCVVCTSTLAEGVNLPIKYLLLTSLQDAYGNMLSTRKFQNLIGRTARSGIHTEGSLICTDPKYFDEKEIKNDQWTSVVNLFDSAKSEHCNSAINNIFHNVAVPYTGGYVAGNMIVQRVLEYYREGKILDTNSIAERFYQNHVSSGVKNRTDKDVIVNKINQALQSSIYQINEVLKSVELLIFDKIVTDEDVSEEQIVTLATKTLAYKMSSDETKDGIKTLFLAVAKKILSLPQEKRRVFSLAMNSYDTLAYLDKYLCDHPYIYNSCEFDEDIWIQITSELLINSNPNTYFAALDSDKRNILIKLWISGASYCAIAEIVGLHLDRVIRICQNELSYSCNMLLSSIRELLSQYKSEEIVEGKWDAYINDITVFQQRLKYGLANEAEVAAYEYGYADRVIAREVGALLRDRKRTIGEHKLSIKTHKTAIQTLMENYPDYFAKEVLI